MVSHGHGVELERSLPALVTQVDETVVIANLSGSADRVPDGVRVFDPRSGKNERRSGDYPRALVLVELLGMAYGPIALVRSHRRLRRHTGGAS